MATSLSNATWRSGFNVGAFLTDVDGEPIRAHQPHIFEHDGLYYWYGSAHVGESDGEQGVINLSLIHI